MNPQAKEFDWSMSFRAIHTARHHSTCLIPEMPVAAKASLEFEEYLVTVTEVTASNRAMHKEEVSSA
jgi:hypothetical protein